MDKYFIIHFSPVKLYPPLQNFIRLLENDNKDKQIFIFTTASTFKELKAFESVGQYTKIIRIGRSGNAIGALPRLFYYMLFNLVCIWHLLIKRPARVLYYESISAFPAWIYKRFVNKQADILVHYHEYNSPEEYKQGMLLNRWFHRLEHWLYPRVAWISHTNEHRMDLFLEDIKPIIPPNPQILPNYPPASWQSSAVNLSREPVKIIYVGALSMDTMYTREMAAWVLAQNGKFIWDIYAYNITEDAGIFLESCNQNYIRLHTGVDYDALPGIISQYRIGVILYTGHILNYEYNAPNKLFEYLVCGLDVWYPDNMKGIYAYDSAEQWPKVLRLDFKNLKQLEVDAMIERKPGMQRTIQFTCEEANHLLLKKFIG